MTISLTIEHKDQKKEDRFIPVSTQGIFEEYWLPACYELGLEKIPLIQTGYPVIELNPDTIPLVLDELARLKDFIAGTAENDLIYEGVLARIERLISELNYVRENWDDIARVTI